jgi:hypothetical protein
MTMLLSDLLGPDGGVGFGVYMNWSTFEDHAVGC